MRYLSYDCYIFYGVAVNAHGVCEWSQFYADKYMKFICIFFCTNFVLHWGRVWSGIEGTQANDSFSNCFSLRDHGTPNNDTISDAIYFIIHQKIMDKLLSAISLKPIWKHKTMNFLKKKQIQKSVYISLLSRAERKVSLMNWRLELEMRQPTATCVQTRTRISPIHLLLEGRPINSIREHSNSIACRIIHMINNK